MVRRARSSICPIFHYLIEKSGGKFMMLIVFVSSAGGDVDSLCFKCWHNHCPLPSQVAGEQGRAGADHRRADVEEGGHLEGGGGEVRDIRICCSFRFRNRHCQTGLGRDLCRNQLRLSCT